MNSKMATLLSHERLRALSPERALPFGLQAILDAGIHHEEGFWGFRAMRQRRANVNPAMFPDAVGYECFINKFHIEDYLDAEGEPVPMEVQFVNGLRFVQALQQQFPREERFTTILSCDDERCVVRFYKARPGQVWLDDDLDGYPEEAILEVLDQEPGPLAL